MQQDTVIKLLSDLVAFPTVSSQPNVDIVDYIDAYLEKFGISSRRTSNEDGTKQNIVATIGDVSLPGVVLSAHTDVVPVEGQTWTRDPFKLSLEGDKAFGRGTTDMKGFLACTLALAPELVRRDIKTPVHLTYTYDEEIGCFGVGPAIEALLEGVEKPKAAIIGEPTELTPYYAHKGSAGLDTRITGLAAHSSNPGLGANAIFAAARLVELIEQIQKRYAANPHPEIAHFTLPYTTTSVGVISGGNGRNLVPGECQVQWDIREAWPGDLDAIVNEVHQATNEQILPMLRQTAPKATVETTFAYDVKGLSGRNGQVAVDLAQTITGSNYAKAADYATEAGFFEVAGIPAVVCGPGDIAQAHTADEWVSITQLNRCMTALERMVEEIEA